jgi:hypothetical protein
MHVNCTRSQQPELQVWQVMIEAFFPILRLVMCCGAVFIFIPFGMLGVIASLITRITDDENSAMFLCIGLVIAYYSQYSVPLLKWMVK